MFFYYKNFNENCNSVSEDLKDFYQKQIIELRKEKKDISKQIRELVKKKAQKW